ncbi:alanine--tRNA ligase [Candidatus Uhrbacteria bacterium]|nr:alanine--tRNA ligase [Candidatus Uhrbacteria bacterium]
MTIHEIRDKYLAFFESKGHSIVASSSLIPTNDPTTLFTGSGMQPMVPFLLGEPHPEGKRITDSQKCFRAQDIEEVGDNRHTTFFEMLGNWSLGDYFKKEQIPWIFEFLTKEIGLDPKNLYITVFRGNHELGIDRDVESVELWKSVYKSVGIDAKDLDFSERDGMQDGRIFYYDETKNWWSRHGLPANMPVGEPGGPDSEMFWDFGKELGLHERSVFKNNPCHVNCDCGRFLEIANNVFMEYIKTEDGFKPLPNKNVDFGGGLSRIAAAAQNDPDLFNLPSFKGVKERVQASSNGTYGESEELTASFRVIMDHLCAATFLIADGVVPSNKDQGYFTRRLIRRAIRFGRRLNMEQGFSSEIASVVIDEFKSAYPSLEESRDQIINELSQEEEKFSKTLQKGEREFEKMFSNSGAITGNDAFILYSTYGFPLELTEEMAKEKGQDVDREVFTKEFEQHQELSRAGSSQKFTGGLADHSEETVRLHTTTHMLHQALKTVLGDHVVQRGSNITPKRLRFDFTHKEKMTDEERGEVEKIINEQIQLGLSVHYEILSLEEAKSRGAIGLFEDKYSELGGEIKVYFIGDEVAGIYFSKEVCGGPHVENTASLGVFKLKKETSVAAGIRRIKAVLE